MQEAIEKIIYQAIERKVSDALELKRVKAEVAKEFGISMVPNASIVAEYRRLIKEGKLERDDKLWTLFSKRKIRNLSGVAVITVLTKPYYCPGRCAYCPTEAKMPKSYLANEPGAARALRYHFDPYQQVEARLESLAVNGHNTDKCELIVLGGTWTAYEKDYQEWFIKRCFEAFNGQESGALDEAKTVNETAQHRVIGLTLETRPDHITVDEVKRMRWLGCTRVQLGVQTTDEDVLRLVKRDQTNEQVIVATRLLKQAGLKISYHLMQGLPGSDPDKDFAVAKEVFTSANYQPDHVKLYPTLVLKTSVLYQWWKQGRYKPYSEKQLQDLLKKIKKIIPEWVRVERVIRDIPGESIVAGNTKTNLRQLMQRAGVVCRCIRCREPGHAEASMDDVELVEREYAASGGQELFLSYESKDLNTIYGFTRLRLQKIDKHWLPVLQDAALIREIHVYGNVKPIDAGQGAVQHIGMGRQLIEEAEQIAKFHGYSKIAVIAGVGVREYFRKLGYELRDEYMVKEI